jgi:hypothetical protein
MGSKQALNLMCASSDSYVHICILNLLWWTCTRLLVHKFADGVLLSAESNYEPVLTMGRIFHDRVAGRKVCGLDLNASSECGCCSSFNSFVLLSTLL